MVFLQYVGFSLRSSHFMVLVWAVSWLDIGLSLSLVLPYFRFFFAPQSAQSSPSSLNPGPKPFNPLPLPRHQAWQFPSGLVFSGDACEAAQHPRRSIPLVAVAKRSHSNLATPCEPKSAEPVEEQKDKVAAALRLLELGLPGGV